MSIVMMPHSRQVKQGLDRASALLLPPLSRKRVDIKSHSSVCLSVRPSVCHKNFNLGHNFCTFTGRALILGMCVFVTRPFRWYHVVTLVVTFDLLQGQICCRAGDHNSLNLLVSIIFLLYFIWQWIPDVG